MRRDSKQDPRFNGSFALAEFIKNQECLHRGFSPATEVINHENYANNIIISDTLGKQQRHCRVSFRLTSRSVILYKFIKSKLFYSGIIPSNVTRSRRSNEPLRARVCDGKKRGRRETLVRLTGRITAY